MKQSLRLPCEAFVGRFAFAHHVCFSPSSHRLPPTHKSPQVVQRALAESPSFVVESVDVNDNGVQPSTEASTAPQEGRPPPQPLEQRGPPRTPRKLKLEGIVLRQAIWVAAVVDSEYFPAEVLVVCLVVGSVLVCGSVWVCCWRGLRNKRGRPHMIKKGRGGVQLYQAPRQVLGAQREKTA